MQNWEEMDLTKGAPYLDGNAGIELCRDERGQAWSGLVRLGQAARVLMTLFPV